MSPTLCIAHCAKVGFAYAGLQGGDTCYCGNTFGSYGKAETCNTPCTGDNSTACGGKEANTIYPTAADQPKSKPSGGNFFVQGVQSRVKEELQGGAEENTIQDDILRMIHDNPFEERHLAGSGGPGGPIDIPEAPKLPENLDPGLQPVVPGAPTVPRTFEDLTERIVRGQPLGEADIRYLNWLLEVVPTRVRYAKLARQQLEHTSYPSGVCEVEDLVLSGYVTGTPKVYRAGSWRVNPALAPYARETPLYSNPLVKEIVLEIGSSNPQVVQDWFALQEVFAAKDAFGGESTPRVFSHSFPEASVYEDISLRILGNRATGKDVHLLYNTFQEAEAQIAEAQELIPLVHRFRAALVPHLKVRAERARKEPPPDEGH